MGVGMKADSMSGIGNVFYIFYFTGPFDKKSGSYATFLEDIEDF